MSEKDKETQLGGITMDKKTYDQLSSSAEAARKKRAENKVLKDQLAANGRQDTGRQDAQTQADSSQTRKG